MKEYNFNPKLEKNNIVRWIKQWFNVNGNNCNAIVGISGGKDSLITAALCAEAIGKNRVIGVLLPNGLQNDINDSYNVVNLIGIKHVVINIKDMYDYLIINNNHSKINNDEINTKNKIDNFIEWSEQTKINLAPRLRMATLYAVSQSLNGRVACTDNLSESYCGYSTRWGDNVGDFSPIANFTKTEVCKIGMELGLPYELVYKTPSDGLVGISDEDKFGFTYDELDEYIRNGNIVNKDHMKLINDRHHNNIFKMKPIPSYYPSENKKLLVVVDMQNDFVYGSLKNEEAAKIIPNISNKIQNYIDNGNDIIFTMDTHDSNYLETNEGKHLPIKHCIKGSDGWMIVSEFNKFMSESSVRVIQKSIFTSNELISLVKDKMLHEDIYTEIELVGVCSDICVISNALALKQALWCADTEVSCDSKCCAGTTIEKHKYALETMKSCQIIVK